MVPEQLHKWNKKKSEKVSRLQEKNKKTTKPQISCYSPTTFFFNKISVSKIKLITLIKSVSLSELLINL